MKVLVSAKYFLVFGYGKIVKDSRNIVRDSERQSKDSEG